MKNNDLIVVEGLLEAYWQDDSDEKHYFLFLSFLGGLGPNYYIWELGYFCTPKHVFSHILVKNNDLIEVEGLLEAYWQDDSDEKHYF